MFLCGRELGVRDLDLSGPLGDDIFVFLSLEKLFLLSCTWGLFVKLGLPGAFGRLSEYLTGDVTEALWVLIVTQVRGYLFQC